MIHVKLTSVTVSIEAEFMLPNQETNSYILEWKNCQQENESCKRELAKNLTNAIKPNNKKKQ